MSVMYSCDVFCDECGEWTHYKVANRALSKEAARKSAESAGWRRVKKRGAYQDLCPRCYAEYAQWAEGRRG